LSFHPKRPWILASLHTGRISHRSLRRARWVTASIFTGVSLFSSREVSHEPAFSSLIDISIDLTTRLKGLELQGCCWGLYQFHQGARDDQTIRTWNWRSLHRCIRRLVVCEISAL
ncbi:hypothetical protein SELMODRAFT_77656, partial [Selaginella moellendorffii]